MIFEWLEQTIFANKLVDDFRTIDEHSLFSFEVPSALLVGRADDETKTVCALIPPDFPFYYEFIMAVLLQSIFNAILGVFVFKIVIEPQQRNKTIQNNDKEARGDNFKGGDKNFVPSGTAVLFALGIAMPWVIMAPIYFIRALQIKNCALIMTFLATPIVNTLRLTEALFGFAPSSSKTSLWNYVMYFSCLFGMEFDQGAPKGVSRTYFKRRLSQLGRDYLIVMAVICVLKPYNFEFFDTSTNVDSLEHTLQEMISWKHLLNNFLVAFLLSASLSQSTIGVGLVYNIFYGVQTYEIVLNPMLKSKSPSDFWGRRWNMLIHKGLKNGVYKPTRKHTSSKLWAVVATFFVSGMIHEYVNYVMFTESTNKTNEGESDHSEAYKFTWKQMMFFGWNGVIIGLEYTIGHWELFRWIARILPPLVVTALVLCCALPLAHLFTGDWIKRGYFDAVYLVQPIVVCRRE